VAVEEEAVVGRERSRDEGEQGGRETACGKRCGGGRGVREGLEVWGFSAIVMFDKEKGRTE